MAESMRNIRAAYQKGVKASFTNEECCYGLSKIQLMTWWHAGNADAKADNIDPKMMSNRMFKSFAESAREPSPN